MTVPYNSYIHTVTFAGFLNLLLKWDGSVYKLLWRSTGLYVGAYTIIAIIYHLLLTKNLKILFEILFDYFNTFQENIPVSFILGFYVSCVVGRWWEQLNSLPHTTRLALFVTAHIRGRDDQTRLVRRTIMRYACLGCVLTMVTVCLPAKKRFPTYRHMVRAGFLLNSERDILENIVSYYNKYYVPFIWASTLVAQARKDNLIRDDFTYHCLLDELNNLRRKCLTMLNYDWINIPLVYTQVATLAVYIFFFCCLISRQHIPVYTVTGKPTNQGETIVPVFTFLQYLFFMGWLKVAEELINPFGEDDDDFEINPMIDKSFKLSYMIVDNLHGECPSLVKDPFWDVTDVQMPYTEASLPFYKDPGLIGAVRAKDIPEEKQHIIKEDKLAKLPSDQLAMKEDSETPDFERTMGSTAGVQSGRDRAQSSVIQIPLNEKFTSGSSYKSFSVKSIVAMRTSKLQLSSIMTPDSRIDGSGGREEEESGKKEKEEEKEKEVEMKKMEDGGRKKEDEEKERLSVELDRTEFEEQVLRSSTIRKDSSKEKQS